MIVSLWVLGINVLTISTERPASETEEVVRSVGFAAAELAEPWVERNVSVNARSSGL